MQDKIQITKMTKSEIEQKGVNSWPIWTCPISVFPWEYEAQESCYLLEGEVEVTVDTGEKFSFGTGNFVVFAKDLKCTWKVLKPVRKHYTFD